MRVYRLMIVEGTAFRWMDECVDGWVVGLIADEA